MMQYMTTSPARSIVHDISEETYELVLHGPEGPAFTLSYMGTPVGQSAVRAGNVAVVPHDLEPALRKQIMHLPSFTLVVHKKRFVHVEL